ncbi:flagellar hook-basal body protein [bacterium]|jgi:flagellar basal-body rod protein FlgF|nr:flagellar hook-basal body protein [bacterium]
MDRGTYSSAAAGMLQLSKLEIINNNLANLNTPGFKGQVVVSREGEFKDTLASTMKRRTPYAKEDYDRTPGVREVEAITDFRLGPIEQTGQPLHAALRDPNEFFVVRSADGPVYTRAGNFTLDSGGRLVTPDGMPVLADGGEIVVNQGIPTMTSGGFVQVTGLPGGLTQNAGRVQIVRFDDLSQLQRVGASKFRVPDGTAQPEPVANPSVVPKAIETSNISAIQAIVDLIATNRGFELYTKTARSIDSMNQTAIQRVGRRSA